SHAYGEPLDARSGHRRERRRHACQVDRQRAEDQAGREHATARLAARGPGGDLCISRDLAMSVWSWIVSWPEASRRASATAAKRRGPMRDGVSDAATAGALEETWADEPTLIGWL